MKTVRRILSITLIMAMCVAVFGVAKTSAKSIYFSGEYRKSDGAEFILNQYSSPEGKNVGNFKINIPYAYNAYSGELMKQGKDKYYSKKKGLTMKVYEKKIVVTVSGKKYDKALKGTYKLTKRYPRP